MEACVKGWYWNHYVKPNRTAERCDHLSGRGFGSGNNGNGGSPPPVAAVSLCDGPSANRLRHRIREILNRCETQSEQATSLMDLATATGRTYNEINQLARIIRAEGDLATEVIEAVKSLQSTLTSYRKRLDIGRYIEPLLSEPLLTKAACSIPYYHPVLLALAPAPE